MNEDQNKGLKNGATVLTRTTLEFRTYDIIIAKWGEQFVTACHRPNEKEWFSGHYFRSLAFAVADAEERVKSYNRVAAAV